MYSGRFACVKVHFGNEIYMQHLSHMCRWPNHPPLFSNIGIHIHFRTFHSILPSLSYQNIIRIIYTLAMAIASVVAVAQAAAQLHAIHEAAHTHTPSQRLTFEFGTETTRSHWIFKRWNVYLVYLNVFSTFDKTNINYAFSFEYFQMHSNYATALCWDKI